jgi:hypothetical protein
MPIDSMNDRKLSASRRLTQPATSPSIVMLQGVLARRCEVSKLYKCGDDESKFTPVEKSGLNRAAPESRVIRI